MNSAAIIQKLSFASDFDRIKLLAFNSVHCTKSVGEAVSLSSFPPRGRILYYFILATGIFSVSKLKKVLGTLGCFRGSTA